MRWAFKERRACVRSARSVCGVCVLRGVRRRCERVSGGGGGTCVARARRGGGVAGVASASETGEGKYLYCESKQ